MFCTAVFQVAFLLIRKGNAVKIKAIAALNRICTIYMDLFVELNGLRP